MKRQTFFVRGLRRWLMLSAMCGAVIAGCTATPTPSLQDAAAKYNARQLDQSEAIADSYIKTNPTGQDIDEAYYLRGLSRFTRGNKVEAAADLREALAKTSRADIKLKSHRVLGDIAFEQSHWADAQKQYQESLDAGSVPAATALYLNYRVGACLQAQGLWTSAQAWFAKVAAASAGDQTSEELKDRAAGRMYATHYALQFGAFPDRAKANDFAAQVRSAGVTPTIETDVREGQSFFTVRSGFYPTMADAMAAREKQLAKFPLVIIVP